jgi:hypothetical protein
MEYDVLSGGFSTFFYNHGEHLITAASSGLMEIGALKHQSILTEAANYMDDNVALRPFDGAFYEACQSDGDPREKLAAYILNHLPQFMKFAEA